eukprot:CAMPEP_0194433496 /NCGR_PEP_ID=MMETSP0176-20130528/77069_1 /TAXON_ID=216777 /ORGANISM="Proboscia alata, Strain PI-D3" /LENGTH=55 /DNA_ID=CAMNT_0039250765 /DNA_START=23 /DNA_END=187 /DNA_ORIENTATION=+
MLAHRFLQSGGGDGGGFSSSGREDLMGGTKELGALPSMSSMQWLVFSLLNNSRAQ